MNLGTLKTRKVGSKLVTLESVDSTNDQAWREALDGAPDGTVVLSEEQTKGRGRLGHSWHSVRSKSILMSAILKPELEAAKAPLVTALAALAVVDACEEAAELKTKIRFPNDVLAGDRKLAGILVESRYVSARPDLFIVGIGVNANVGPEDFPDEIRPHATSLLIETGRTCDRIVLLRALINALDEWYDRLSGRPRDIQRAWKSRSGILGRRVQITEAGKVFIGTVEDLDVFEGITLRLDTGMMKQVRGEYVDSLRLL